MSIAVRHRPQAGFTLLEVIIAIAIAAFVFRGALELLTTGLDRMSERQATLHALAFAESQLERIGADLSLEPAELSGILDTGQAWRLTIAEARDVFTAPAPMVAYHVSVEVEGPGLRRQDIRLDTIRLAPK